MSKDKSPNKESDTLNTFLHVVEKKVILEYPRHKILKNFQRIL